MYLSAPFNRIPMKVSLPLLLFFTSLHVLSAQTKGSLKAAEALFEKEKYTEAITQLDPLLEDAGQLSDKERINAYFLRGQAYYEITQDVYLLGLYPEAFFRAYADLDQVTALDEKGKYQSLAFAKIQNMRSAMMSNALRKVNEANIPNLSSNQVADLANTAQQFLDILIGLEPNNYLFFDLRGQAQLARQDSLPAAMDFQTAIRLYHDYPPAQADLLLTYAYYRTALIQRISLNYDQQALNTIRAGRRFLQQAWSKADQEDPRQEKNYDQAARDLTLLELDILYSKEAYQAEALVKFAQAVEKYPLEYSLHCAYASLLEAPNPEAAISQYKKAIALDPSRKLAYYNLAALYVNQSVDMLKGKTADNRTPLEQRADQLALKAVPFLEKAHEIDPQDKQIIRQLMTIFLRTKQTGRYQFYKAKLTD